MAVKKTKSIKGSAKKAVTKRPAKKSNKLKKSTISKAVKKPTKKVAPKKIVKKVVTKKPLSVAKKTVSSVKTKTVKKSAPKKVVTKIAVVKTQKTIVASKKSVSKKSPLKVVAPVIKSKEIKLKPEVVQKTELLTSTEKFVKIGVKTKKQLVAIAPQPVIEISNFPKQKVKTILISQPKPENDKNPYYELGKKYNLIETFRQFIKIDGLPVKDFRTQRIDILEHKAVILTSRMAVDHYFRMCNEMRVTVPESMKYFCINEATAYYLQKYIQYRKRKIFFGHQTIQDLVDVIRKNREERFLLPAADVHKEQICEFLDAIDIKYTKAVMYRTVSADLSDIKNLNDFDVLAFFTPAGINSLKHNFPNFKQGNTRIACFGAATANTLKKHGYRLDIYAPNPKNPSMSGALDEYIKEANKR